MEPPRPEGSALAPSTPSPPAVARGDLHSQRWRLARDLAVFQAKLFFDGLKDLVLAPVALVAVLAGLLSKRDDPGRQFYTLLRWGHGFDRWLNLFGESTPPALPPSADSTLPSPTTPPAGPNSASQGLDSYVDRVEQVLIEQYRRGGLTAKAKDAIDKAIDSLHDRQPPHQ